MAALVPLMAGLGGGAAASALGAGTALSVGAGAATAAGTLSILRNAAGTGGSPSGPAVRPGIAALAPSILPPPAPAVPTPPPAPAPSAVGSTSAASGQAETAAIMAESEGPAEDAAAQTASRGRRSTILTGPQGILGTGGTRAGRSLMAGAAGLIR